MASLVQGVVMKPPPPAPGGEEAERAQIRAGLWNPFGVANRFIQTVSDMRTGATVVEATTLLAYWNDNRGGHPNRRIQTAACRKPDERALSDLPTVLVPRPR